MTVEDQLREALRPEDPGEVFTLAVMARVTVAADGAAPGAGPPAGSPARRRRGLWPLALAASLLLAFVCAQQLLQQRRHDRSVAAAEQLEQALSITSAELQRLQQRLGPLE